MVLYLSQKDIESIGSSVLRDYAKSGFRGIRIPVDIEGIARRYLGLNMEYRKLSDNGNILGLTSYKGVVLELTFKDGSIHITVPEDTILLDDSLKDPKKLCRRRFTIAHECAHQILSRMEENTKGSSCRTSLVPGETYSLRELHSAEDWGEWQANTLGAVLLMPKNELLRELNGWRRPYKPIIYGNRFTLMDYEKVKFLAKRFSVSLSAMKLRLRELDCMITKDISEYTDPREIFCG